MSGLFLLSESQMARITLHFPLSHGVPRVDDRRVISGIVYVIKHGLWWKDAPKGYGPRKTLYNRVFKPDPDVLDHCCAAWNRLIDQPWRIMSFGSRDRAHGYRSAGLGMSQRADFRSTNSNPPAVARW
jgi:transposase